MIKKEIERALQMEKYIQSLNAHQIQKNLLKEDFFTYQLIQKQENSLFSSCSSKPQDRILSLIEHSDMGSYDELEQIESRISYIQSLEWHLDTLGELKNKYLNQRREIVNSGITIQQVMEFGEGIGQLNMKDPFCCIIKSYFKNKQFKNQFLWQFLDDMFEAFEKNPNVYDEQPSKPNQMEQNNIQDIQRINELVDLYRKLSFLIKPSRQQLQQSVKKITKQNQ